MSSWIIGVLSLSCSRSSGQSPARSCCEGGVAGDVRDHCAVGDRVLVGGGCGRRDPDVSVYQPVRVAFLAWQRTQPQLFIELPDASTPTRTVATTPLAATGRPAAPITTNGSGHAHSEGAREAGARQETS